MAPVRPLINEALCPSIPQPVTQGGCINLHRPLVRSGPVQDTHQCVSLCSCIQYVSMCVWTIAAHGSVSVNACIMRCLCVRFKAYVCLNACVRWRRRNQKDKVFGVK